MAVSLRASKKGLEIVDLARKKKGWTKTAPAWCDEALVGKAALRRFWRQTPILQENFVAICQAVGLDNWEELVDATQPSLIGQTSESLWWFELKAKIEEADKPLIDELVARIQQRSPDAIVKQQKVDLATAQLLQNWPSVESVLPADGDRSRSRSLGAIASPDSINRAKLIDLGGGCQVAAIVEMTPQSETEVQISLWVYPTGDAIYLPAGLQVMAIDESEQTVPQLQQQAGSGADSIELQFSIEPGELFAVQFLLGEAIVTENF